MRYRVLFLALPLAFAVSFACTAGKRSTFHDGAGNTATTSSSSGQGASGGETGNGAGDVAGFDPNTGGNSSSGGTTCDSGPDEDKDQDGFSKNQGDCNDCDPNVNPNAVEVIAEEGDGGAGGVMEPADEDCDDEIDELPETCDSTLAIDSADPMDAARAVDLCTQSSGPGSWGVVMANWVAIDGSPPPANNNYPLGHGILSAFGPNVNVQGGAKMLALSSGSARQPTDPGYHDVGGFDKGYTMNHPQGFPKESPACPNVTTGQPHDGAAVEITVLAPSNAHGFAFDFNFYTYEWPGYVCSMFNDFFVAILDPIPQNQTDGNISFDQLGNPVSVNNAFLEVCGCSSGPPCQAGGKSFTCALGNTTLLGTGFGQDTSYGDHGSTSWLVTQAPVEPNSQIKIRWGVYDSGDGILDTTTLIDHWRWIAKPGTKVGTEPIPDPR
jgi:hypothetical protein